MLGTAIRLLALALQPVVERRKVLLMPVVGLGVGALAILFVEVAGHSLSDVLFSGQSALPDVVLNASNWTVGALVLLAACKSVAYGLSLSSFRGGPIFPAMFIGGVIGVAASHLPGLSLVPAVAMGIGAMATVMLKLPMTSTLLPTLLLSSDGLSVAPLVIVAVVVTYVAGGVAARHAGRPQAEPGRARQCRGDGRGGARTVIARLGDHRPPRACP